MQAKPAGLASFDCCHNLICLNLQEVRRAAVPLMPSQPFQIQPWTILGIKPDASADEIRAAFREKSKKHHPDLGGDDWAFRMVQHAYEMLRPRLSEPGGLADDLAGGSPMSSRKAEAPAGGDVGRASSGGFNQAEPTPNARTTVDVDEAGASETFGSWFTQTWPEAIRWFFPGAASDDSQTESETGSPAWSRAESAEFSPSAADSRTSETTGPSQSNHYPRTIEADLIWVRFAIGGEDGGGEDEPPASRSPAGTVDDTTLSVCLVVTWPPADSLDRVGAAASAVDAESLRAMIAIFDRLKEQVPVLSSRSRIEDGRFVGWLSFPDVLRAQDAFHALRDAAVAAGFSINLQTRQERLPVGWRIDASATTADHSTPAGAASRFES
jgi:hypothetical protein